MVEKQKESLEEAKDKARRENTEEETSNGSNGRSPSVASSSVVSGMVGAHSVSQPAMRLGENKEKRQASGHGLSLETQSLAPSVASSSGASGTVGAHSVSQPAMRLGENKEKRQASLGDRNWETQSLAPSVASSASGTVGAHSVSGSSMRLGENKGKRQASLGRGALETQSLAPSVASSASGIAGAHSVSGPSMRLGENKEKRQASLGRAALETQSYALSSGAISASGTTAASGSDGAMNVPGVHAVASRPSTTGRLMGDRKEKQEASFNSAQLLRTSAAEPRQPEPQEAATELVATQDNSAPTEAAKDLKELMTSNVEGYLRDDYVESTPSTTRAREDVHNVDPVESENFADANRLEPRAPAPLGQSEEQSISTGDLAVARKVVEDDTDPDQLPQAEDFDEEAQLKRRQQHDRKNRLLIAAGLAVLAIIIALVVGLLLRSGEGNKAEVSSAPSAAPSLAPTSLSRGVLDLLPIYSRLAIEESSDSPQARAFQWLLNDTMLLEYPDWQVVRRFALATLYYASGGEDWHNGTNWLDYDIHECDWQNFTLTYGLVEIYDQQTGEQGFEFRPPKTACSLINGTTTWGEFQNLWLYDNNLKGTVPEEMWLLTSLKRLALPFNVELRVTIPTQIGKLTDLEVMALSYTNRNQEDESKLPIEIPSQIGQCSNLRGLMLPGYDLNGTLPTQLGNVKALEVLFVDDNPRFEATIPSEIGRLQKLRWLNGWGSALSGSLPSQLGLLTALTDVEISSNRLQGEIPSELGRLSSLQFFGASSNMITGTVPTELGLMQDLIFLNLRNNELTGKLPSELGVMTGMYMLSLRNNQLSGTIPTEFGNLGLYGMERFAVSNNTLTGQIPSELGKIPAIDFLQLHDNQLSGAVPAELGLVNINEVHLSGNMLSGTIPSSFCSLTSNCTYTYWSWEGPIEQPCVLDFECSSELCGCNCNCTA